MSVRSASWLVLLLFAAGILSCGGGGGSDSPAATPTPSASITSFSTGANSVTNGQSTTLMAVFVNGAGTIDHSVGNVVSGVPVSVSPTTNTTYTLTVVGAGGSTRTASVSITVVPAPSITDFEAIPSTVRGGNSILLMPTFTTDGSASIDQQIGTVTSGSQYLSRILVADTTFTLTVTNSLGAQVTRALNITVSSAVSSLAAMAQGRTGHSATWLPGGKVLIAGGNDATGTLTKSSLLFDPSGNGGQGTYTSEGDLSGARWLHTATLLPSGKVLIAGGSLQTAAELYNPATHGFEAAGNLASARIFHTATLLTNGQVMVTGGSAQATWSSVEFYNPSNNTWRLHTTGMSKARSKHQAVLMQDGRVLIFGGSGGGTFLADAEMYDPAQDTFTPVAGTAMQTARAAFGAVRLGDGKVLVAGGEGVAGALASVEVFDPGPATFSTTSTPLTQARSDFRMIPLADGRVLAVGGANGSAAVSGLEVYDPATPGFSRVALLSQPRMNLSATLLESGRVYLAGGALLLGGTKGLGTVDLFTPSDVDAGRQVRTVARMATTRHEHVATRLADGRVLITGGYREYPAQTVLASAEIYDPQAATFTSIGSMTSTRLHHTATLLGDGRVLIAGGTSLGQLERLKSAEVFNPITGAFTVLSDMNEVRESHTATRLQDGRVLLACGVPTAGLGYGITAETFNPSDNTFTSVGSLDAGEGRRDHTATLMNDGRVLLVGGSKGGTAGIQSAYAFNPSSNTFARMPDLLVGRLWHGAALTSTGEVLIAGGMSDWNGTPLASSVLFNPSTNLFSAGSSLTVPRAYAVVHTLLDGRIVFSGGLGNSTWHSSLEAYTSGSGFAWDGEMGHSRSEHAATVLQSGRVLITGGMQPQSYSLSTGVMIY